MLSTLKNLLVKFTGGKRNNSAYPSDFRNYEKEIIEQVKPFTMTSAERIFSLIKSVEYIIDSNVEGSFVECGVWKGGSSMAMALTLQRLGISNREIFLYDTFEGMSDPTENDIDWNNKTAEQQLNERTKDEQDVVWAYAPIEAVKRNITTINYPENKLKFIKGKVEDTIPEKMPEKIALLRLDTDWYESTRHELIHLFPKLQRGGILILDDYGHWQGARKAVDEYFQQTGEKIFLARIDETGRIAVKLND